MSSGAGDPFGGDPFGSAPVASPPVTPAGEVNTLATLSVVFAFVFAPAGAVLGHLALGQIRRRNQPGRNRAVLGLALSYAFILLALVALLVWLLVGGGGKGGGTTVTPTPTGKATVPSQSVDISTSMVTQTPVTREEVEVEDLRVGDCFEFQQTQPDPNMPSGNSNGHIYRVPCEVRDGVMQVTQLFFNTDQCPDMRLYNGAHTLFACWVKYGE